MASERNGEGGLAGDLEMERLGSKAGSDDFVTVFEKDLDDDEDLGLLDWDQYARIRRRRFCGVTCPDISMEMPMWWYKLPKKTTRLITWILALHLVGGAALLVFWAFAGGGGDTESHFSETELARQCGWDQFTLPTEVLPTNYDVSLDLNWFDDFHVHGNLTASLEATPGARATVPSRCYVLHAGRGVHVKRIAAAASSGLEVKGEVKRFNQTSEQLVIELDRPLAPAEIRSLSVHFSYPLQGGAGMRGFYRSSYKDSGGVEHTLASTQFEATDARRAFPCFDQPDMKATYDFRIGVKRRPPLSDQFQVLFNTGVREGGHVQRYVDEAQGEGYFLDERTFETTPKMSTYLVAFVVGDLASVEGSVDSGRVQVKVWGTPEHAGKLSDALRTATAVLPAYEGLFGIAFPLKKLDLVAIPSFEAGAMENWGLITYRETSLLIDRTEASDSSIMWATSTIAHELAHQWFGNLVTMKWWNDLFLNEGFAEYIQYIGTQVAKPWFGYNELFPTTTLQGALSDDSFTDAHAIHVPLEKARSNIEIDALFDGVTYDKGASIIRMLRAYLSAGASLQADNLFAADPFILGLREYLYANQYGNTDQAEFWQALASSTGQPVAQIMSSWVYQANYPLVSVSWQSQDGSGGGELSLSQAPFKVSGLEQCTDKRRWWIPLGWARNATSSSGPEWGVLSECEAAGDLRIPIAGPEDYVKLNPHQAGFFRVMYPEDLWHRLVAGVATGELSSADAANLLDDAAALVKAGELGASLMMDLVKAVTSRAHLASGQDYQAWRLAVGVLGSVHRKLQMAEFRPGCLSSFEALTKALLAPALDGYDVLPAVQVGPDGPEEGGDVQLRMLRSVLFGAGYTFDMSDVQVASLRAFGGEAAINPNVRTTVYRIQARQGEEGYRAILDRYKAEVKPNEKRSLLAALGAVRDPAFIQESIDLALSPLVDPMYVRSLLTYLAMSSMEGREAVWQLLRTRFRDLYIKTNGSVDVQSSRLSRVVRYVGAGFAQESRVQELRELYEQFSDWIPARVVGEVEENVRANREWLDRNIAELCEWVDENA